LAEEGLGIGGDEETAEEKAENGEDRGVIHFCFFFFVFLMNE
jgi:hypothetical protein